MTLAGQLSAREESAIRHRRHGLHNAQMPRISTFYGIAITMHWRDHPPPHFHASYAGHVGHVDIESLDLIQGELPPRALRMVREWAGANRKQLRANWELARAHEPLELIPPLP